MRLFGDNQMSPIYWKESIAESLKTTFFYWAIQVRIYNLIFKTFTFTYFTFTGYPLRPWLLTPLTNAQPGAEERFNAHFKSIRSTIERCNGVLKNRFRCLLKHRVLHYEPTKAAKIVLSCAVLHNICTQNRVPEPDRDNEFLNADLGFIPENEAVMNNVPARNDLEAGRLLRERLIQRYNY